MGNATIGKQHLGMGVMIVRNGFAFSMWEKQGKFTINAGDCDEFLRWLQANSQQKLKSQELQQLGSRSTTNVLAELKVCSSTRNLELGKIIHTKAIECGNDSSIYVATALVDMYAKCGCMIRAHQVFDCIETPDVVAWTALILGYAENGEGIIALDLFARMRKQGCVFNSFTYVAALKACTVLALKRDESGKAECLKRGKQILLETGYHLNTYVQNTSINMFAKCGNMAEAREMFDSIKCPSVVSWTALISGYAENGEGITALQLFARMKFQGCVPNSKTFVAALKACTSLVLKQDGSGQAECLVRGKQIHIEIGCHSDNYVLGTLIDMYTNCGSMVDAHHVFDSMKHPNVVAWNALILGYAENGDGVTALDLFTKMKSQGCAPTSVTFLATLKACGLLGALESGRTIHNEMDAAGTELDVVLVTSLLDCYAKCGSLVEAQKVFDMHPGLRDMKTWTALLAGYSRFGDNRAVFGLFEEMQDAGFEPNDVTFLCILMCCSHAGLFGKANEFFDAMSITYGIAPTVEHYTCMIDILGRSNKLDDVMILLMSMPCKPNSVTWSTVLGACRRWKNVELGRLAFSYLASLDDKNAAAYALMSHIYGSRGMWEEQKIVSKMRKYLNAWKEPEKSCWTNELGEAHTFFASDNNNKHPQILQIQEKLKAIFVVMEKYGYNADVENEEEALCGHSEKLAIALALINTQPGKTARIVKNARVCDDCHAAIAFISKLEQKTIICRDSSRFHVFKNGSCLCGNLW